MPDALGMEYGARKVPSVTAALGRLYYRDGTQAFEPVRPAEFYSAILGWRWA
jgi:hypothetical protein